jgi:7-carboxy-7-deazaguanine synthase
VQIKGRLKSGYMSNQLETTLQICELFAGIQGESTYAGQPCGFIRVDGCNLRCVWCDTAYAFEGGNTMSVKEILEVVESWQLPLVEITGGEPLLQSGCIPLAEALLAAGYATLIETNGSQPIDVLPDGVVRIMDIKCPGSGMSDRMHWPNVEALTEQDEVKFVLADRADYDWALEVLRRYDLAARCKAIHLSPVSGSLDAAQLAAWVLEDRPPARLQLQLHKIIWPADMRGV